MFCPFLAILGVHLLKLRMLSRSAFAHAAVNPQCRPTGNSPTGDDFGMRKCTSCEVTSQVRIPHLWELFSFRIFKILFLSAWICTHTHVPEQSSGLLPKLSQTPGKVPLNCPQMSNMSTAHSQSPQVPSKEYARKIGNKILILLYITVCFALFRRSLHPDHHVRQSKYIKIIKNQGEPTCDSMILYATWNTQGNKLPPSTETSLGAGSPVRAPASRPPGRRKAVARGSKDVVGCRMMPG